VGGLFWLVRGAEPAHSAAPQAGQATAARRTFTRTLRLHGTVEPVRSHTVSAPRLAGPSMGPMVITRLTPAGSRVKQGGLLVEFDRQAQMKTALDRRAEYLDLLEQIKKRQAEQSAARAKDQTELRQAENAAESARLELRKNEVISRIDAEKNQQSHEEAVARLAQLRDTFELKRRAAQAELRILEIQRDRANSAMRHAEGNAAKLSIVSGIDGLVVLNAIWKGNTMAEVGEGDEVRPGVPFMQVVNP
jgi:multidrug efflux pump subunit AcrA (membrane-fusion protein)